MKVDLKKLEIAQAEKGLDNQMLCEAANISMTTLIRIKSNKVNSRVITVGKLAKALGVEVKTILN